MGKILKKYNETTGEWEPIPTPDVSVIQVLPDEERISDTNVFITNENYMSPDSGDPATLDEALTTISDDISKLQRNVSWLAQHGVGGGGGGGQTGGVYGIEVAYFKDGEKIPIEKGQGVYTESNTISVLFTITGGTPGEYCTYTFRYGKTVLTDEIEVDKEKPITVEFDKSAVVIIEATNPYGSRISPFNFTIYKSALSIKIDAATAGGNYDPGTGILQMSMNTARGIIPILVSNGLGSGSTIDYTLSWAEQTTMFTESCNTDKEYSSSIINLWQLPGVQKTPGLEYPVTIRAVARLGSAETPIAQCQVRVRIINPLDLTLAMSVNGLFDSQNPIDVELDTPMNIAFRAYAPNAVSMIYYAGKVVRENGEVIKIYGKYYDETLKDEGALVSDNERAPKDTTIALRPYTLVDGVYNVDEIVTLYLKAWSVNNPNAYSAETSQRICASEIQGFFPRQYGKRHSTDSQNNVMFASWNATTVGIDKYVWASNILNYAPVIDESVETMPVTIEGQVLNKNGYSGIQPSPARLRLQNNAYFKITIPEEYREELSVLSASTSSNLNYYNGYTLSITFQADETPLTDRVAFLWGVNMANGTDLARGIKITSTNVAWKISDATSLNCSIAGSEKHTIDFVFDRTNSLAKIYINGVLNTAQKVNGGIYPYENNIFVGCNYHNGAVSNSCDMSLYEFSIYTHALNDTQLIVNSKNAKLESHSQEELSDYGAWKIKNFFSIDEGTNTVHSMFEEESFDYTYITGNIAPNSNIPTLMLSFPNETSEGLAGFTEEYFYEPARKDTVRPYDTEASYYYDNETNTVIEGVKWAVELQGTSTLKYRVKNLELYTTERVPSMDGGDTVPVLFQPKENWFPEQQFTLKADVVDSAHANNTVIGQWINDSTKCPILEKTPPMVQLESNPPKDIDQNGVQLKNEFSEDAFNRDVTIKHTTEGFPILLFISFAGESDYKFIGIYSFNLGRFSHYNLGLRFLESFSRYKEELYDTKCPRMIRKYKEVRTFGNINADNVYSYEFDNLGSDTDSLHPVWSQYGMASWNYDILDSYGEFKYGTDNATIRASLSNLLETVAKSPITYTTIYRDIYNHRLDSEGRILSTGERIVQEDVYYGLLRNKLHLKNAVAYFVIANAFGMTDSIGKNMTLRTWDGVKWYTCFYDMDTALGLDNTGRETIPANAAIDFIYYSFEEGAQQGIQTIYHSDAIYVNDEGEIVPPPEEGHEDEAKLRYSPTYAAYKSKLWAVLRDTSFLYDCGESSADFSQKNLFASPYIYQWQMLRNTSLSRAEYFSEMVRDKVAKCGEIIYDKDYDSKYIRDGQATSFLHGTRVEYIRQWLRNHIYFLDGMLDINLLNNSIVSGIEDSPYYSDMINFKAFNRLASNKFNLKLAATTPTFFTIGINTDSPIKYYIEEPRKEYDFVVNAATNTSTQMQIYGSSLLSEIEGLSGIFEAFNSESTKDSLEALTGFKATTSKLGQKAFENFKMYLDSDGGGQLETLDISNSTFDRNDEQINLGGLTKVLRINVSNTNLQSLILPDSSLDYLNVTNSNIGTLKLNGQNKLTSISIDGCTGLTDLQVTDCEGISSLVVEDKINLHNIEFGANAALTAVTITECPSLTGVTIYSNPNLEELVIDTCESLVNINVYNNKKLRRLVINNCGTAQSPVISIKDSPLTEISLSEMICSNVITLPAKELMTGVTSFSLRNCYSFSGIKYDGSDIEVYGDNDDYVLDFSPMTSLDGRNLSLTDIKVKYIRVKNEAGNPLRIYQNTFIHCTDITKIFGYIELMGRVFSTCRDFYINHDETFVPTLYPEEFTYESIISGYYTELLNSCTYLYDGIYPPFVTDDPYYTNVKIGDGVTSLMGWFNGTSCDIHDVYYMLQLCNTGITTLETMFSSCDNIVLSDEEWLDINMFSKCTNVSNIDYLFYGCNINCIIIPEPFEPLINKLEKFNYVLYGNYGVHDVGACFFPEGNKIKEIAGFNPSPMGGSGYFSDTTLLTTLTALTKISDSFNDCSIDFTTGTYDATELFKFNRSLVSISNSFRRIGGVGTIRNLFGGDSNDDQYYPRDLESITNSFTFGEGSHDGQLFDGDDGDKILMPLGNTLFKSVPKLKFITGNYPGQNRTNPDFIISNRDSESFCGNGLLKYIDNIPFDAEDYGYHRDPDCDADGFPHKIFSGLTLLQEIPALFDGAKNFKDYANGVAPDINVSLLEYNGVSMFKDCLNLQNISKLFRNMDNSIVCTLSGKAFKNCKLVNLENAFTGIHVSGKIPFGLFYQSTTETWDNGETYELENPTIENMISVLEGLGKFTGLTPYSAEVADLVMDNPEFTIAAEAGSKNAHKKIWNVYAYDGTGNDFTDKMNAAITLYGADLYTAENPFAPYIEQANDDWNISEQDLVTISDATGYAISNVNHARLFIRSNYFCPPDMFKYCRNWENLDISRALNQVSGEYDNGVFKGLYGRIPEMIFSPLTEAARISEVFSGNQSIFPHSWYQQTFEGYRNGVTYPESLFSGLSLQGVTGLFAGTRVWPKSVIPAGIFTTISPTIREVSSMWNMCKWVEKGNLHQLPAEIFQNCSVLTDVSGMLGNSQNDSISRISKNLFTPQFNPRISRCSNFMRGARGTTGDVPEFWMFSALPPNNSDGMRVIGAFADLDRNKISNYADIEALFGGQTDYNPYLRTAVN